MGGFYDVQNLGDFKVTDIPSAEDNKQNLAIAKNGPLSYTTTQRNNLTTAGEFKAGAIIYNTTTGKFQGFTGAGWGDLN